MPFSRIEPACGRSRKDVGMDADVFTEPLMGQEPERRMLAALRPHLGGLAVDVGAERGEMATALLDDGWGPLTLIEASPRNVESLRARFEQRAEVTVLGLAASDRDGTVEIRVATTPGGKAAPAFDSAVSRRGAGHASPGSPGHLFGEATPVEARSLDSLVEDGLLPATPDLLKVDVEGMEVAVLAGAAGIRPSLLMVEHWLDLPGSHGGCPWTLEELRGLVGRLGLRRFACFSHGELHTRISLDEGGPVSGEWANLIFFDEQLASVAEAAVSDVRAYLETRLIARVEAYRAAAEERLAMAGELKLIAAERLQQLETVSAEAGRTREQLEAVSAEAARLREQLGLAGSTRLNPRRRQTP